MKRFASIALGAAALTAASIGVAEPAAARTNVGVYVSPFGIGVALNPDNCGDYWFRQNHWNYCAEYYGSYGYWPYFNGYYNNGHRVHHDFDRGRYNENHWRGDEHRGGNHGGDHRLH